MTKAVAAALRQRGIDCSTTAEAGLRGADDDAQFDFALKQSRVLITADDDFLGIAAESLFFPGLIYWRRERHFGQLVIDIVDLAEVGLPEDFANRVIYLA